MSKSFSAKEVKEHSTVENGLYIIIDNGVYEMASFVDEHPGGAKILKRVGGKGLSRSPALVAPYTKCLRRCLETVLEVPQRERAQEVPTEVKDWRSQGRCQIMRWKSCERNDTI